MSEALKEARNAYNIGEVPVGAVIVKDNKIIATAHNMVQNNLNPLAHAEVIVIYKALRLLKVKYLSNCDLYSTLEPCVMCAAAISHSKIKRLFYGAQDIKFGAIENEYNFFNSKACYHKPEIYNAIKAEESSFLLKNFFKNLRV